VSTDRAMLARRLERFRDWQHAVAPERPTEHRIARRRSEELARRLVASVDGELLDTPAGRVVRLEIADRAIPVDRERLGRLPGHPGAGVPLVCLDTETTGLGTAAGRYAFLVGLGWWEGDTFREVQLLLPDLSDEPAFLDEVARHVPRDAWLVSYNGIGFDWPLLVTRWRMQRAAPPAHDGHLDLLPLARRLFRHRSGDARLRSIEAAVLGIHRIGDVDGWEIPGRYLAFLRGGDPDALADVVRHNEQDVRTLARLLAHVADAADPSRWFDVPAGDLAGLSRLYRRAGRLPEALECLDAALDAVERPSRSIDARYAPGGGGDPAVDAAAAEAVDDWWAPRRVPDFGGRRLADPGRAWPAGASFADRWTDARLRAERARLLRRLGRHEDAATAWQDIAVAGGVTSIPAWIEVAKLREHVLGDLEGALAATRRGLAQVERQRQLRRPQLRAEADLLHRANRLSRRLVRRDATARRTTRERLLARAEGPAA
jgi:uncharacterized protein YprB with RNaseH-like and TPR domain